MHSNATKTNQSNIASKNAWGTKKRETLFINSVVGGGGSTGGGVSYVTSNTRSTNNVQGTIVATGINSDLGMQGQGMFVVADSSTGTKVFTRRGDFRQDELGYWKNGADQLLFANKLDKDEKPPKDASLLSSLSAVNFANVKGDPKATTTISIAMNFNSAQEALRGAGVTAAVKKTGINATANTSKEDILFSENLGNAGGLNIGDRFTFTSTPPGLAKTIEYGGLAIAVAPNGTNKIFNAAKVGDKFNIGPAAPAQVPEGATLVISLSNGSSYTFSVASNPQAANKTFNSIQTLANAINKTGGLNAKISKDGNLYIASEDPDLGMTFQDGNGGTFKDKLGLVDVPTLAAAQALPGGAVLTQRFNNLQSLNTAVNNKADDFSLKATIESGSLKITSLLATDKFTIDGQSLGVRSFNKALFGNNSEKDRASVTITAPKHGLQTGDLVNVTGLTLGQTPDGIYAARRIDDDNFDVYLLSDAPGAAAGGGAIADGLPAAAATVNIAAPGGGTWQKVAGQKFPEISAPITAVGAAGQNALLTITPAGGLGGIGIGDVIFISNGGQFNVLGGQDVTIADGYYVVQTLPGGGTFTIKSISVAVANAFPVRAGNALTYQKVGKTEAAGNAYNAANGITTFNTTALFTTNGLVAGDNKLTLNMSSHNYQIGDTIRFNGLPAGYAIDGITVNNNENYKVIARTGSTVTFTNMDDKPPMGGVGGANVDGTYSSAGAPDLGPNFRIDNVSRLFEYFSISEDAGTTKLELYNADDIEKSLSGNEELESTESFTQPFSLYDSLGENYTLNLKFAKLGKNEWAVEVAAVEDPVTGQYDIAEAKGDGQIKAGRITFDENGQFIPGGALDGPITITRKNGSAPSQVTIDWKNQLGKVKSGSVTQYESKSAFNVELTQQDGQAAGNLINLEVTPEGFIVGTFDSGQTRKLYQIPVALFANVNGLRAGIGGTFEVTRESGELLLKNAMSGGAGKVLGGVLEAANVDTTEELLELQDLSNDIRANARAANVTNKNIQTILSEIQ